MIELNPTVSILTNNELIVRCDNSGYVVDKNTVREICSRIEALSGQVKMWHTLADATRNANTSLIKYLREFQTQLDDLTGDGNV